MWLIYPGHIQTMLGKQYIARESRKCAFGFEGEAYFDGNIGKQISSSKPESNASRTYHQDILYAISPARRVFLDYSINVLLGGCLLARVKVKGYLPRQSLSYRGIGNK